MYNLIYTEMMKTKRSLFLWTIAAIVLFPTLITLSLSLFFHANYPKLLNWAIIFQWNSLNYMLFAAPSFAVAASYLFAKEYQDYMMNTLFTYPHSR